VKTFKEKKLKNVIRQILVPPKDGFVLQSLPLVSLNR
jgi:hypothetical protein